MLLSIVIPVFNSAGTIGPLCRSLVSELSDFALEIILINDGSEDGSEDACLQLQAEHPALVTYLQLSRNFGEHNAVMAGLHHASGHYVVTMDDDLQNPPAEVRKLLAEMGRGHDIVYGRFHRRHYGPFRRVASRLHRNLVGKLLRRTDTSAFSTFRVMNRFLRDEIIKYQGPMPYIDAIVLRLTSRVASVAVSANPRREGRSNYTLAKLLGLWGNAVVSYSLIPLRLIGVLGITIATVALVRSGWHALDFWHPARENPTEYERLATLILFFRGLQLTATAIVGEYVGRVLLFVNRDPQFVIRVRRPAAGAGVDDHPRSEP